MCKLDQCGWYGECVAPNQCRCPRKYTRVIKLDNDDNVIEVSSVISVTVITQVYLHFPKLKIISGLMPTSIY